MTKKKIVLFSILISFLTLMIILFGAVFCLRKIDVKAINAKIAPLSILKSVQTEDGQDDMQKVNISSDMIIKASGLKKGRSIFAINKNRAISNIESTYPSLKVIRIKTVSLLKVEIEVRQRVGTYYVEVNEETDFASNLGYYILDEDLVIVDKLTNDKQDFVKQNYTRLYLQDDILVTSKPYYSKIGNTKEQLITASAFDSICSVVKIKDSKVNFASDAQYVERNTFPDVIKEIGIYETFVADDLQNLAKDKYWLVVKTNEDIVMKILCPDIDLQLKLNYCFSAIPKLDQNNNIIVCNYDQNGNINLYQTNNIDSAKNLTKA